MRIGTLVNFTSLPEVRQRFERLQRLGFDSCQLCSWEPKAWTEENAQGILELERTYGVEVFARAVITDGRLDLYRALATIADARNVSTILNSLLLGLCVVLLSSVIALPTAFLLARTQLARHKWLDIVFMIPFMTPPYIASMGWILFM